MDDDVDQTSVIAAFIKRFREEPPTSPEHRSTPKDKEAFWWLASKNLQTKPPPSADISIHMEQYRSPLETKRYDEETTATGHDSVDIEHESNPMDISEGEVPRADIPIAPSASIVEPPAMVLARGLPRLSMDQRAPSVDATPAAVPVPTMQSRQEIAEAKTEYIEPQYKHREKCSPSHSPKQQPVQKETATAETCTRATSPSAPAIATTAPGPTLNTLLSFQNEEEEFEFDFGMDDLDIRTNQLLQKCDSVLENFKAQTASSSSPSTRAAIQPLLVKPEQEVSTPLSPYRLHSSMDRESFQAARDAVITSFDEARLDGANGRSPPQMLSPLGGMHNGNDSIFSLTSVITDEEDNFAKQNGSIKEIDTSKPLEQPPPVPEHTAEPKAKVVEEQRRYSDGKNDNKQKLSLPEKSVEATPPRRKASGGRKHRHQLASPESVRSINGLSIDNSGLFMFLSSSEEGGVSSGDEQAHDVAPSAPGIDADLSRSSAFYSEDYHRLMNSLQGIEMLGPRGCADKKSKSDHPYEMLHASRECKTNRLSGSNVDSSGASAFVVNLNTVSAYIDDEIVSVLWRQLVSVRAELRRRAVEEE